MAFTEPQFCLPTEVPSDVVVSHVTIAFAGSAIGPTTVDVVIPTGTYWTVRDYTSAAELAKAFCDEANTAEFTVGTGPDPAVTKIWTVIALSTGHAAEIRLARTAFDVADDVTSLTFEIPAVVPASRLGFPDNAVDATLPAVVVYTSRDGVGGTHKWDSGWMGRLWMPGQLVLVEEVKPRREVAVSVSRYTGKSVVLALGKYNRWNIVINGVWSALIWSHYLGQAAHVVAVSNLSVADINAPLEMLWDAHGIAEPLRYYPDYTDLTTYHNLEIVDPNWLRELDGFVTQTPGTARFQVRMPCKVWVT